MRIVVNNDESLVNSIRKKLKDNDGYCPCRLVKNEDTECMCKDFINCNDPGPCHCGLYVKVGN